MGPKSDRTAIARMRADHPFDQRPVVAMWDVTLACDHACAHCRPALANRRDEGELDTLEGSALIEQIASMGTQELVLSGGDPAKRDDLEQLVAAGRRKGMNVAVSAAATPVMQNARIASLALAGLSRMAVRLDAATPGAHDQRFWPGSHAEAIRILEEAHDYGLEVQVETTLGPHNYHALEEIAQRVHDLGAKHWSVFVPIAPGRTREDLAAEGDLLERALHHLAEVAERKYFEVRTSHAPQFRRVQLLRRSPEVAAGVIRDVDAKGRVRGVRGVNDGAGILYISHLGDVYPSAFLPLRAGNVRTDDIVKIYRDDGLFRALRDTSLLTGKCGECPFRSICGGSRARAWAVTGDPFEADPFCTYLPPRALLKDGSNG